MRVTVRRVRTFASRTLLKWSHHVKCWGPQFFDLLCFCLQLIIYVSALVLLNILLIRKHIFTSSKYFVIAELQTIYCKHCLHAYIHNLSACGFIFLGTIDIKYYIFTFYFS